MSENKRITKWQIDQGPPPYPNDRERELALRVMSKHERGDGSTPALLTAIAKALAKYRLELRRGKVAAKVTGPVVENDNAKEVGRG